MPNRSAISRARAAAAAKSLAARWGDKRSPSRQIRVDAAAAAALRAIPDHDRRRVASTGVLAAVRNYTRQAPGAIVAPSPCV